MAKGNGTKGVYFPPDVEDRRKAYYDMADRQAARDRREQEARSERKRATGKQKIEAAGFDGRRELVTETVAHPRLKGQFETVSRNARHDPIEQLYNQRDRQGRRIIGEGERMAGLEIRAMVEALGLDAVRSVALGERVDGGARVYDIGARRYDAGSRAQWLRNELGRDMFDIVVRVAGYGETITMTACDYEEDDGKRINGGCSKGTRESVGWLFRRALRRAATRLGYGAAHGPNRHGEVVSWAQEGALPVHKGS